MAKSWFCVSKCQVNHQPSNFYNRSNNCPISPHWNRSLPLTIFAGNVHTSWIFARFALAATRQLTCNMTTELARNPNFSGVSLASSNRNISLCGEQLCHKSKTVFLLAKDRQHYDSYIQFTIFKKFAPTDYYCVPCQLY